MNTYPLTPQGLEDFQEDLSQLTRLQLEAQADAVASDFKTYVKDLFILSSEQEDFVDNLNPRLANYYGASCSICFIQMLPISFVYPPPPGPGSTKWTTKVKTILRLPATNSVNWRPQAPLRSR